MSEGISPQRPNLIRRLYAWTVAWADRPGGGWALFFIAFAESLVFPVPPDVLLIALCFGNRGKWLKFAVICILGSACGAIAGWGIGWGLREPVAIPLLSLLDPSGQTQGKIQAWYAAYGFWGLLVVGLTPIPDNVFSVFSGMMGYSLPLSIGACALGKGLRFFLIAALIRLCGTRVRPFIERYLEWCFAAVAALLIGGFVLVKYLR
jgi:membrane protein YqaA with SNARE-associated domain